MPRNTWPLMVALAAACDAGDDDDDGTDTSDCRPESDPAELDIRDVAPAPDAVVPNVDIVHSFVIADSPGVFTSLQLLLEPEHTAGTLDPPAPMFTIMPRGDDVEYSLPPVRWMAVGRVQATFAGEFADDDGCHYVFPPGIFSYDLQEP